MPTATGSGESVFVTARSAAGFTVVDAVELLLLDTGSLTLDATVAVLLIVPVACGRPLIWMVGLAPLPTVPSWHVTTPLVCEHVPCDGVAESKIIPAGQRVGDDGPGRGARAGVADRQVVGELLPDQHRVGRVGLRDGEVRVLRRRVEGDRIERPPELVGRASRSPRCRSR